jgi:hypothetical protein
MVLVYAARSKASHSPFPMDSVDDPALCYIKPQRHRHIIFTSTVTHSATMVRLFRRSDTWKTSNVWIKGETGSLVGEARLRRSFAMTLTLS